MLVQNALGSPAVAEARVHPLVKELDALTTLRFFAAIFVVLYHYPKIPEINLINNNIISLGHSGVTFFFILSGFILAYNYRGVNILDKHIFKMFLLSRFARIYPIYFVMFIVSLPFAVDRIIDFSGTRAHTVAIIGSVLELFALQSWIPGASLFVNPPSWSVSTEFFFYIIFPFTLLYIYSRPERTLLGILGIWGPTTALAALAWDELGDGRRLWTVTVESNIIVFAGSELAIFFPLARICEFFSGIALCAFWEQRGKLLETGPLIILFILASALVVLFQRHIPQVLLYDGLTGFAWAPLILAAANMRSGPLVWGPMVFLGRASFSLYLVHAPLFGAADYLDTHFLGKTLMKAPILFTPLLAATAVSAAAVLYLVIEAPGRRAILNRGKALLAPRKRKHPAPQRG